MRLRAGAKHAGGARERVVGVDGAQCDGGRVAAVRDEHPVRAGRGQLVAQLAATEADGLAVLGRCAICHTIVLEEGARTQHDDTRIDLECATLLECRVAFKGGVCKAGRPTVERGNADGAAHISPVATELTGGNVERPLRCDEDGTTLQADEAAPLHAHHTAVDAQSTIRRSWRRGWWHGR